MATRFVCGCGLACDVLLNSLSLNGEHASHSLGATASIFAASVLLTVVMKLAKTLLEPFEGEIAMPEPVRVTSVESYRS